MSPARGSSCRGLFGASVIATVQEEQPDGGQTARPGPVHRAVEIDLVETSRRKG